MRHSVSPRSRSAMRNVKRPVWSAERRLQRATSRTGPSVRSAPLAMCCILCSHGPFVYPSPHFPLSTKWSGGEGERRSGISFPLSTKWSGGEGERRSGISFPLSTKWRGGQGLWSFRRRLLAWYQRAARDLPWRRTRDPYRVLVSEFMLQQTQVSRVAEYYPRFLERFPDLKALAQAKPRAVREAWDGLGYYARARNLHALARQVARRSVAGDGVAKLPEDPEELVKLPGVGPYTAGAVAAFAYEKSVPAVDTNVARVIRRVFFGDAGQHLIPQRLIWSIANALVPRDGKRAWRFNQAIMELGALICVARKPKCPECPIRPVCRTGKWTTPTIFRAPRGCAAPRRSACSRRAARQSPCASPSRPRPWWQSHHRATG